MVTKVFGLLASISPGPSLRQDANDTDNFGLVASISPRPSLRQEANSSSDMVTLQGADVENFGLPDKKVEKTRLNTLSVLGH